MNKKEEIFTVGDRISYQNDYYTISNFEIVNSKCLVQLIGMNFLVSISRIQHIKNPILTTDDGVEVFEGDTVWGLYEDNKEPFSYELGKSFTQKWNYGIYKTKESAEEAALMYKPLLSINDLENLRQNIENKIGLQLVKDAKELVKSRL